MYYKNVTLFLNSYVGAFVLALAEVMTIFNLLDCLLVVIAFVIGLYFFLKNVLQKCNTFFSIFI